MQVHYKLGTLGKWSNVWHTSTSTIDNAASVWATEAVPVLLPLLHQDCTLDRLLVSNPLTKQFIIVPVNEQGTSGDSGSLLPLFNSARVLFPVPGFGRPDLKYLKGFLTETLVEDMNLLSTTSTGIKNQLNALIDLMDTNSVPLTSETGQLYSAAVVQDAVQMRQMHRKRRKKISTTPPV